MRLTELFTTYEYRIKHNSYGNPEYLIPFGDVHRSSELCAVDRWHSFLDWAKLKGAYLIGMGDYDDLMSTTERKNLNLEFLHEQTAKTIEEMYEDHTNILYNELKFAKGRIIGLLEGNHYVKFGSGETSTQMLCRKLGCKYLGVATYIRLTLERDIHHACSLKIFAHHGKGSGITLGSSVNSIAKMMDIAEADIFLMGHDHKKSVAMVNKLDLSDNRGGNLRIINKKIVFARTGAFLKGYEDGENSYVAKALLRPTDLGVVKIEITPKRTKEKIDGKVVEDRYLDIHASI